MAGLTEEQKHRIEENKRKALALRAAKNAKLASIIPQTNPQKTASPGLSRSLPGITCITGTGNNFHRNRTGVGSSASLPSKSSGETSDTISKNVAVNTSCFHQNRPPTSTLSSRSSDETTNLNIKTAAINTNAKSQTSHHSQAPYGPTMPSSFYKSINKPGNSSQLLNNQCNTPSSHHFAKTVSSDWKHQVNSEKFTRSPGVVSVAPKTTGLTSKLASVKGSCVLVSRQRFEVQVSYCAPLIEMFHLMPSREYNSESKRWSFDLKDYELFMQKAQFLVPDVQIESLPRAVLQTFKDGIKGSTQHDQTKQIPQADLSLVDSVLVDTLMPFQRDGVNFAVAQNGRILIADDMGLGKTLQAICIACYYRREWPLLVVTPSSVRFSWRDQFLQWVPSLDPQEINVIVSGKDCTTTGLVNIISYDLMARQAKDLVRKGFEVVVMDESHGLKNFKTARTQAAESILKQARRVVLLSGTPALSRPAELFTQVSMVNSRAFPYFREFGIRYCAGKQMPWGWDFTGSSNLEELQVILEEHIMIRRLKRDVIKQLPDKVRQMVVLDPGSVKVDQTMKATHKLVDKMKGNDRRGTLLQYFHDTSTAKVPAVKDYVLDLLESGSKFLLFAHHQEMLDAVEKFVGKKHGYIRIDGKSTSEQRNYFCKKFQTSDDIRIAILSITAANAGLNLTAATLVVFAELFWNPGILVQAEDRAHRIGQEDSVTVHYLIAKGTSDDYIWPLVQQKLEVLSKAGLSKDDFSTAESRQLMDPNQRDIMSYFQQSFFEDDMVQEDTPSTNRISADKAIDSIKSGPSGEQKSLFSYFKSNATSNRNSESNVHISQDTTITAETGFNLEDWGNDDLEDLVEEDFNEPLAKRAKSDY